MFIAGIACTPALLGCSQVQLQNATQQLRAFSHYKFYQRQDFVLLEHYQWFLVVIWLDAANEVWLALLKDFH